MERYTTVESPTVKNVRDILDGLIAQGFGDKILVAYDPEDDTIIPITGFLYNKDWKVLEICTDDN